MSAFDHSSPSPIESFYDEICAAACKVGVEVIAAVRSTEEDVGDLALRIKTLVTPAATSHMRGSYVVFCCDSALLEKLGLPGQRAVTSALFFKLDKGEHECEVHVMRCHATHSAATGYALQSQLLRTAMNRLFVTCCNECAVCWSTPSRQGQASRCSRCWTVLCHLCAAKNALATRQHTVWPCPVCRADTSIEDLLTTELTKLQLLGQTQKTGPYEALSQVCVRSKEAVLCWQVPVLWPSVLWPLSPVLRRHVHNCRLAPLRAQVQHSRVACFA